MLAHAEVHLRGRAESDARHDVDEEPDLDAPALDERHRLEHVAPAGVLAAERLDESGELGEEHREQRTGDQLGDAAAAGGLTVERPPVVPLHERDVGVGDERSEQPGHEVRRRSCGCRRRASRRCRRSRRAATSTSRCPCPSRAAVSGSTSSTPRTPGALPGRGLGGGVGGAVVDDDDLVHEGDRLHEGPPDGGDDVADGGLLVAGRQAHRDPQSLARPCGRARSSGSKSEACRGTGGSAGGVATAQSVGAPGAGPARSFAFWEPAGARLTCRLHALIQSG